ncbi:MAG: methyltransferase domain-containing protein [Chitinivibrionales bacterium]|nr:methyltransferase domain-containing protein [Chitinivibrionales bacterium]
MEHINLWEIKAPAYHILRKLWPLSCILSGENNNATAMLSRFAMKKMAILDIGCGTGNGLEVIPVGNIYIGVDLSFKMLFHMRERFKGRAIQANGYNLPVKKETVDLVFAMGILEYQKDAGIFLSRISRPIKEGGHLFLTSSPPSWHNSLRKLNGSLLWPRDVDEVVSEAGNAGLCCEETTRSLLQEQFLFVKKAPENRTATQPHDTECRMRTPVR